MRNAEICYDSFLLSYLTPQAGFEPATNRLTADRSTTELLRNAAITYSSLRIGIWQVLLQKFLGFFLVNAKQ